MPASTMLIVERRGAACWLTLNRPDKRNALNPALVAALTKAIHEASTDPALRMLVLRGAGEVFCAGADIEVLRSLHGASFQDNLADSERLKELFLALIECPKPTIALVDGPALAGGAGLMSCCDYVLATERASFGYPEVRIGFVAAQVMALLVRQVGERAARDLLLSGRSILAREALAMGLITRVVPPAALLDECEQLGKELGAGSPQAQAHTKQLLRALWSPDIRQWLDAAAIENARARESTECKEGVAAFLEKRKPGWRS